jgi:hypothetical protein
MATKKEKKTSLIYRLIWSTSIKDNVVAGLYLVVLARRY